MKKFFWGNLYAKGFALFIIGIALLILNLGFTNFISGIFSLLTSTYLRSIISKVFLTLVSSYGVFITVGAVMMVAEGVIYSIKRYIDEKTNNINNK